MPSSDAKLVLSAPRTIYTETIKDVSRGMAVTIVPLEPDRVQHYACLGRHISQWTRRGQISGAANTFQGKCLLRKMP